MEDNFIVLTQVTNERKPTKIMIKVSLIEMVFSEVEGYTAVILSSLDYRLLVKESMQEIIEKIREGSSVENETHVPDSDVKLFK